MAPPPPPPAPPLPPRPWRRHLLYAPTLALLSRLVYVCLVDAPPPGRRCPLDPVGLSAGSDWTLDASGGCYWSESYPEAREKFVALGNRLREQLAEARGGEVQLDVLDVRSASYDVSGEDYLDYLESVVPTDASESQPIDPGADSIDALLLTLRVPDASGEAVHVVHSSGVHGVEGYLGSAVQLRYLHELFLRNEARLRGLDDASPPPPNNSSSGRERTRKVLLIHAVNPYGMRHHRRTNRNNVDLNRNVLSDERWAEIRGRDPNFVGYVDMDETLNPFPPLREGGRPFSWEDAAREGGFEGDATRMRLRDEEVREAAAGKGRDRPMTYAPPLLERPEDTAWSWIEEKGTILRSLGACAGSIAKLGYTRAKRALVSAQYHKPTGVSYGGGAHNGDTWENEVFALQHAIRHFAGIRFDSTADRALWIDVHTGLGKFGDYSVLVKGDNIGSAGQDESAGSPPQEDAWASKFAARLEGSGMGYGASGDAGVSAGYDQTSGFVTDAQMCPPPRCFAATQEFGTRPGVAVAIALVLENRGRRPGSSERGYGHLTSWAFYPRRLSWRMKTLRGGMDMLRAALDF